MILFLSLFVIAASSVGGDTVRGYDAPKPRQYWTNVDTDNFTYNYILNYGENGERGEDINFTRERHSQKGRKVTVTVVGRGILGSHQEFLHFSNESEIHAMMPDNITRYEPSNYLDLSEGTSSASIAFGNNSFAPEVTLKYMYAPLAYDYRIQLFTDEYRKIKSDIILLSAKHSTFKIRSGDISFPYVQLFHWTNATEQTTLNEPNVVTIISAGDEGIEPIDCQFHSLAYVWNTAVVSSSTSRGSIAWYSQWSVCLLCNAPGGGADTYSPGNFRENPLFHSASSESNDAYHYVNGTSVASAIVASVVALMKEKFNNSIDFRQVMYRIASTAIINDPNNPTWTKNKANYFFSPAYGFGRINADAALALDKLDIGINVSSLHYPFPGDDDPVYLPYGNEKAKSVIISAEDAAATFVEQVQVSFATKKIIFTDLSIRLKSPSGTLSILRRGGIGFGFKKYEKQPLQPLESYILTSRAFFGENARGNWTLDVRHTGFNPLDEIWGINLKISGTNSTSFHPSSQVLSPNDPYNYSKIGKIEFITKQQECNKTILVKIETAPLATYFTKNDQEIYFPTYLKMQETNRTYDLDYVNISYRDVQDRFIQRSIVLPCLLNQSVPIIFGIKHPINGTVLETEPFHLINEWPDNTITNYPLYHAFDNPGANSSIRFYYARQDKTLPEHGFNQQIQIVIFDLSKRNIYYTYHSKDIGYFDIVFNTKTITEDTTEIRKGVLSINPMLDLGREFCRTTYFPFRIYSQRTTQKPTFRFRIPIEQNNECPLPSDMPTVSRKYIQELDEPVMADVYFYGIAVPVIVVILNIFFALLGFCLSTQKIGHTTSRENEEEVQILV